ncbi:MAG: homocysteine S-methyltransferase family protein [Nocardioides sp.]|uniref:homocysteine S-methyltransferase family protein n=1 Tax=Nocardioides sp. TaxID=35761 RepID=UPI0039E6A24B
MSDNRLHNLLGDLPVVIDGGYGWLMGDRGLPPGEAAEFWNVDHPDVITALHEEYAVAGARILTTNTFGGSRARLVASGLADRTVELNRAAARLARAVADRHQVFVAGNVGPTGELLEPLGTLTETDAVEIFAEQVTALREGGADLILIETMSDLAEVAAAIEGARRAAPELPIVATMSFDTNLRTMMGVTPRAAVEALAALEIEAVGANCGRGPEEMIQIATEMAQARGDAGVLLAAQSNAGLPQVAGAGFVYDVDPAGIAEHGAQLRALGFELVGSCCGSSAEHTRAIAERLAAEGRV